MAKIDFDSKNIGIKIHDDGEFDLPAALHALPGQDLSLPQRYSINKSEAPNIIFDRYPGWTDDDVKTELERVWTEDEWPGRVSHYISQIRMVKQAARDALAETDWKMSKALERADGDYTHADVQAVITGREEIRAASNDQEAKIKADLLARKHPDEWPEPQDWSVSIMDNDFVQSTTNVTQQAHNASILERAKTQFGVEDPGSGL